MKPEYIKKAQGMANECGVTIVHFYAQGMPWFVREDSFNPKDAELAEYIAYFRPTTDNPANDGGISVGIREGNTTNWYRACALNRCTDGAMVVYALNSGRTAVIIPARLFKGVMASHSGSVCNPDSVDPCILTWTVKA